MVGWPRSRIFSFAIFIMNGKLPNHTPSNGKLLNHTPRGMIQYRGLHRKSCTRTSAALTLLSESGPVEGKPRNIFSQRMDGTLGTSLGLIGALSPETWLGLGAIPKNSRRIVQVTL